MDLILKNARLADAVRRSTDIGIDDGRIVERGRHDDLMAAGGLYTELYRTQFLSEQRSDQVDVPLREPLVDDVAT